MPRRSGPYKLLIHSAHGRRGKLGEPTALGSGCGIAQGLLLHPWTFPRGELLSAGESSARYRSGRGTAISSPRFFRTWRAGIDGFFSLTMRTVGLRGLGRGNFFTIV